MKALKRIALALPLLAAAACTPVEFFVVNAPTYASAVTVKKDVAYGTDAVQKLDIYLPDDQKDDHPVVVFFYGGRWTSGDKSQYRFVGTALARRGFVVVVPDYRKYPDVKFPVFVEDGARAVAWTYRHIATYGGAADMLHVAGHSAGAHIGALIAADEQYLKAQGESRSIIKSFAGMAGPYAFTPDEPDLEDMFGPPARYPQMQVPTFVDGQEPPMLLLYGADDKTVGKFNLDRLQAAIEKKGGCVQSKVYPGLDHAWLVGSLSWLGVGKPDVLGDMTDFFKDPRCPVTSGGKPAPSGTARQ